MGYIIFKLFLLDMLEIAKVLIDIECWLEAGSNENIFCSKRKKNLKIQSLNFVYITVTQASFGFTINSSDA